MFIKPSPIGGMADAAVLGVNELDFLTNLIIYHQYSYRYVPFPTKVEELGNSLF